MRLEDIYSTKIINENVEVVITNSEGKRETFTLDDTYGKVITRQLRVNSSSNLGDNIDEMFKQADWTGPKQVGPKTKYKEIVINSQYEEGVDLTEHLATKKDTLLKLSDCPISSVFNFTQQIASKLPSEFVNEDLNIFIQSVHLNVIPKAATGVGLGESTFSLFGTAQKGSSGDLQWDGSEVEIKTNGPNKGSGAILGGDGYINKITDRLEVKSDYINLNSSTLNKYKNQLVELINTYNSKGKEQSQALYTQFVNGSDQLKNLIRNGKLTSMLDNIADVEEFMNKSLTKAKGFTPMISKNVVIAPEDLLPNRLLNRIINDTNKADNLGTNLPSQLASLLGADATVEDYITVFSEMKTYSDASNIESQLKEFFQTNTYTDFNPKSNYNNFQRLVGAISIVCYQEKIGFDYLTAGNDDKMTMVIFETINPTITSIYNQLDDVHEVTFDLNIDVYEGGSFKSQTVIAKSPRIKLN
ncbi:hypothetical protein N9273_00085 [bacterium]|nr:hypothetical protein [bacterium]